ncbi:MAG TPA: TonB-dependent receptor [Candidatus Acidoferrales bacterium]|nr:TonB-dependent receptor [Candidatus Acidoferrales bacterium]
MNRERTVARLTVSVSTCRAIQAFAAAICTVFLFATPVFSQINTGRILGTVTDQSGGVIAGAMVAVTNTQTGVVRNLVTDDAGEYNAPNLIPGTYSVRVTAMGFQAFERQKVLLETGRDDRIDAQLTPGQVTQTVTVTEAVPLLDTTSTTVTGTLETATIADLPVQGRNYQNLLQYRPGVTTQPGGGTLTTATNGLRPEDNNYYVEGLDNDEPFTGQSIINSTLPVGDAATFVPIDAIQEVNVETNSPAEFGKRPGAVINVGLKSGTNAIHGTAFAFGRSDKLDSAEWSSAPAAKQPAELEQWGGTVGGPIAKDKLFYYAAYERQTYNVSANYPVITPTSANTGDPNSSIPTAEAGLAANGLSPNPLSLKLLPLFGINTNTGPNASAQAYGFPNVVSIYNVLGKIDYHLSDHHTFAGAYFFGNGTTIAESITNPGITQPYFRDNAGLRAQFVTTSWTWTPNSTWVNDLRFGWNFHHRFDHVDDITTPLSTYGINTGITNPVLGGFPTVQVGDFSQLGGDPNLPKSYGPTKDYDVVDHVSFLRGKHAFKFGGEMLFMRPYFGNYSKARGVFNFTTGGVAFAGSTPLEDFLAGDADASQGATVLNGSPLRQLKQEDYSVFFEDSWHVKPHVTLNLGLRYEYFTPLADSNNQIGGWDPQIGLFQVGVNVSSPYNPYHKDFSPRLGVAWDIGGKGKTVLRAGGGVYYIELVDGAMVDNIALPGRPSGITSIPTAYSTGADGTAPPLLPIANGGIGTSSLNFAGSALTWNLTGPILPAGQIGSSSGFKCGDGLTVAGVTHPSPCSVFTMSRNLVPPRVETYTLGIQRTLTSNYTLEVNYIGDFSNNLAGVRDLNAIDPTNPAEIACGHCESITHRPYYTQFPYLQYINYMSNIDVSNYNALQTMLTARGYHGLGFTAAYTYSHALDDASQNRNQNVPMDNLNGALDYGPSNFDQRHHFALSLNYALPGKKGYGQMIEGWSVNSAVLIQSGLPWNAVEKRDISKTGDKASDRWDFFGNPSDFTASKAPNIPFYSPKQPAPFNVFPAMCTQEATAIGTAGPGGNLAKFGCYMQGNSVLIAPPTGTFGTASRNLFRDDGFRDWDFSLFKNWTVKERLTAQFRAEFFNILNHTILANPGSGGISSGTLGCSCQTPDAAGQNPLLGTGSAREIQLGLKLLF